MTLKAELYATIFKVGLVNAAEGKIPLVIHTAIL